MRVRDTFMGAGFVGAGALVFAVTLSYPPGDAGQPGPAFFPRIVAVLMAAFGVALAMAGARRHEPIARVDWRQRVGSRGFVDALFVIGAVVGYIALADRLGFLITGTALAFVLMYRLQVGALRSAVVAVVFTVIVHFLFFKVLRVPLPTGLLWW